MSGTVLKYVKERVLEKFNYFHWSLYCCRKLHIAIIIRASLVAQSVKNLPAMPETQIRSWGREDTLEKEMETHSSILS